MLGTGASVYNVAVQTNLQMLVANELRGRVMGIWSMVHTSVRPSGEMQFSALAALLTAPFAFIINGVLIIAFALAFMAPNRQMRRLRDLREEAAQAREDG